MIHLPVFLLRYVDGQTKNSHDRRRRFVRGTTERNFNKNMRRCVPIDISKARKKNRMSAKPFDSAKSTVEEQKRGFFFSLSSATIDDVSRYPLLFVTHPKSIKYPIKKLDGTFVPCLLSSLSFSSLSSTKDTFTSRFSVKGEIVAFCRCRCLVKASGSLTRTLIICNDKLSKSTEISHHYYCRCSIF